MKRVFKKVSNSEEIKDVSLYVKEFFEKYPKAKIAVGSDSLEYKHITVYATIIALFYPSVSGKFVEYNKGAHLLFNRTVNKKTYNLWTRLWTEVELSMEVADYLENTVFNNNNSYGKTVEIHLDLNPDEQWESNKVLGASFGMLKGLGYNVQVKPLGWVASCAADACCR